MLPEGSGQPPEIVPVIATPLNRIDLLNSSNTPLDAAEVFPGDVVDITLFGHIHVFVFADVDSAINGLAIRKSSNGVDFDDDGDVFTIPAGITKTFSIQADAQFIKVEYTNGALDQTVFRLQVALKATGLASSHRIQDSIIDEDDAQLVKAVITGEDIFGNFINFGTNSPQPVVDLNGLSISRGNIAGFSNRQKFGRKIDLGTTKQTIWSESAMYIYLTTGTVMNASSGDVNDTGLLVSSGNATGGSLITIEDDGADFISDGVAVGDIVINDTNVLHGYVLSRTAIEITLIRAMDLPNVIGDNYRVVNANDTGAAVARLEGFDINYVPLFEYYILNGRTAVAGVQEFFRTPRAKIVHAGSSGWGEGKVYFGTGVVAIGVPPNIYCLIEATKNQTLQAFDTIPDGKTGYLSKWYITVGTGKELEAEIVIREPGGVFQVQQEFSLVESPFSISFDVPLKIPEHFDIEVRGKVDATTAAVTSAFDITFVDN